MEYQHTQLGTIIVIGILIPTILILVLPFALGAYHPVIFIPLIILGIIYLIFYSLTVKINNGILNCYFGIGLIRRQINLTDIKQFSIVRNPWFAGWGIHWMPGQYWLWNVSGFQAVELVYQDGKRFRIGTDEPEELEKAIRMNKSYPLCSTIQNR